MLRVLSGITRSKLLILRHDLLFFCCVFDICTVDAKAMVGKTTDALARIKAVEINCTVSPCIVHCHAFIIKRVPISLKHTVHEVKITNVIKY